MGKKAPVRSPCAASCFVLAFSLRFPLYYALYLLFNCQQKQKVHGMVETNMVE